MGHPVTPRSVSGNCSRTKLRGQLLGRREGRGMSVGTDVLLSRAATGGGKGKKGEKSPVLVDFSRSVRIKLLK